MRSAPVPAPTARRRPGRGVAALAAMLLGGGLANAQERRPYPSARHD